MPDTDLAKQIKSLEELLVDDQLQELEQHLGRFNIFDALGVARAEIRHSNFLAWLLDPYGSHGQGDLFLKALLIDLLRKSPAGSGPYSPVQIDGCDLRGVEIRREWRNIDLLITCESPAFVVAIENKVHSGEHSDQLARYEKTVREAFAGKPLIFVFLTIEGDAASDEDWVPCSYAEVHNAIARAAHKAGPSLAADASAFLDHYLRLLKGRFMQDEEIDKLCRVVIRKHRKALEVLYDYLHEKDTALLNTVAETVRIGSPDYRVVRVGDSFLNFALPEWQSTWPLICDDEACEPWELLLIEARITETRMELQVKIAPASDVELRARIIQELAADPAVGFRSKQTSANRWLGLGSKQEVDSWPLGEPRPDATGAHLVRLLNDWKPTMRALTEAVRRVCSRAK